MDHLPDVSHAWGAPMGRRSIDEGDTLGECLYLRRVRIDAFGYDSGGAYWGYGAPLWWCGNDGETVSLWFRARDRDAAKVHVRTEAGYPNATFWR